MPSQTSTGQIATDFGGSGTQPWTTSNSPASGTANCSSSSNISPFSEVLFLSGFSFTLPSNPTNIILNFDRFNSIGGGSLGTIEFTDFLIALWWWDGTKIVVGSNLAIGGNWPIGSSGTNQSYSVPSGDVANITQTMANDTSSHTDLGLDTYNGVTVTGSVGFIVQNNCIGAGSSSATAEVVSGAMQLIYGALDSTVGITKRDKEVIRRVSKLLRFAPKKRKRNVPPIILALKANSVSYTQLNVNKKLSQKLNLQSVSQSEIVTQEKVTRLLNSQVTTQSENNSNFYLATLLPLTAKSLLETFSGIQINNPVLVQQLSAKALAYSIGQDQPIYYVNLVGRVITQSFLEEVTKSRLVNLKSGFQSGSQFVQQVHLPYLKNIYLQSKSVTSSEEQVNIKRQFNIYSTVITTSIESKTGYYIQRELW